MSVPPISSLVIVEANLDRPEQQQAVLALTDAYAKDPMGEGAPLPADVRADLIAGMRAHPTTIVFLAYADSEPIGIANCFLGFSTFAARPLLNIQDLNVLPEYRGRGVGRRLLDAAEGKARALGCCKLTLEVGDRNAIARRVYERAGFRQADFGEAGGLLAYAKPL